MLTFHCDSLAVEHSRLHPQALVARLAKTLTDSLELEVNLTPKPGLVDRDSSGAHADMDLDTFLTSIGAISPYLVDAIELTFQVDLPPRELFAEIRVIGQKAEKAMFEATGGVNTHKGAIFTHFLLGSAVAYLLRNQQIVTQNSIQRVIQQMTEGIVARELQKNMTPKSHGEKLYMQLGATGIRGEAESGFASAFQAVRYWDMLDSDKTAKQSSREKMLMVLLYLCSYVEDTTVLHRAGPTGLQFMHLSARTALLDIMQGSPVDTVVLKLDKEFTTRRISPGGCADLLAFTIAFREMRSLLSTSYAN